jgi:hypothetical protein
MKFEAAGKADLTWQLNSMNRPHLKAGELQRSTGLRAKERPTADSWP